ncbi:MAG: hypothetical protein HKO65_10190 [Gemmatimonadetes bacterium]|nr:hypothetical protein [Gemmatimonadota bacterium]NNM05461.1 hypothetical protein [Gemmatimonadota bacterium]
MSWALPTSWRRRSPGEAGVLLLVLLCAATPFFVGSSLFFPVISHYWTEENGLNEGDVSAWVEHYRSNEEIIKEVNSYQILGIHSSFTGDASVEKANEILGGRLELPPNPPVAINWPFDPVDVVTDIPTLLLPLASLVVVDVLLEAHGQTSEERFLEAAQDYTLDFLEYERSLWLPEGLVLNDHALAIRTLLLTRLLAVVNDSQPQDLTTTRRLLEALDRSVSLLAKPGYFTYKTNHGLMESLAVMHAAIVAPMLPSVRTHLQSVFDRTDLQLQYLVSEGGIVTEHSSGYQEFNLALLGLLLRYASILDHPIPDHWIERYSRAADFLRHLKRPDGTLPRFGDTRGPSRGVQLAVRQEEGGPFQLGTMDLGDRGEPLWLDLDFGYWSEWHAEAHLLAGWADFGGRAHKQANELSVIFWWEGEEWWTAGGVWPWAHDFRIPGMGWEGNNGPHLSGEPRPSQPSAEATVWYWAPDLSLLELRRLLPSGLYVHRVVARLGDETWLVMDGSDPGAGGPLVSNWVTMSTVEVEEYTEPSATFLLRSSKSTGAIHGQVLSGSGTTYEWLRGSLDPWGGWTAEDDEVRESSAMVLSSSEDRWHGLSWRRVGEELTLNRDPWVTEAVWRAPDDWTFTVDSPEGEVGLTRNGDRLILTSDGDQILVPLNPGGVSEARQAADSAYSETESRFSPYREVLAFRKQLFRLAMLAGAGQFFVLLLAFGFLRRHPKLAIPALAGLFFAHVGFGWWLNMVYLAP